LEAHVFGGSHGLVVHVPVDRRTLPVLSHLPLDPEVLLDRFGRIQLCPDTAGPPPDEKTGCPRHGWRPPGRLTPSVVQFFAAWPSSCTALEAKTGREGSVRATASG